MSDFDYWPKLALDTLVRSIHERGGKPPPKTDTDFWLTVLEECRDNDPDGEVTVDAPELATDVINELQNVQFTFPGQAAGDVAVGDLGCAESRLSIVDQGIKGIVYLASHDMEPLWASDGVTYHTIVVSPAIEPSKTLSSQLMNACTFLKAHRPALICSSCPRLPALVLAAYQHRESGRALSIRSALATALDALHLASEDINASDMSELEAFSAMLVPSSAVRNTLPMPPPPASSPVSEEEEEGAWEPLTAQQLTTPKMKGKKSHSGGGVVPLKVLSSDSTLTQVEHELERDITTPTAKKGVCARGGPWKRSMRADETVADDVDDDPPLSKYMKVRPRTVEQPPELVRGTCTICFQDDVLGWARRVGGFECAACHDSNDEE